ncbi:MAG: hypothetical protein ABMB14_21890 [Myxococcota bacterium]
MVLLAGCPKVGPSTAPADRDQVIARLEAYRSQSLAPARIPPPSLDEPAREADQDGVHGLARLVRSEDADWNRWIDGGPRLFNNRAAVLFDLTIEGRGTVVWDPDRTRLEVNDERTVLLASASAEGLLGELLFHAYLEEQWAVGGDLVNRTRAAGPFRAAYLPGVGDGALSGVVAFPLGDAEHDWSELHVVALRLTVPVTDDAGRHDLVFVFD